MTDNLNQPDDELEPDLQVSNWIESAMNLYFERQQFAAISSASECNEEFLKECKEAGFTAQKLVAISSAVMDIGFMPLSFSKYLKKVEELTETVAEPVLRYFGIANPEALDDRSVMGFGLLWNAVGVPLREALANLRITLLHPDNILWEGLRLRGIGGRGALELCESELRDLQRHATASQLLEQHRLELMLLHAYANTRQE